MKTSELEELAGPLRGLRIAPDRVQDIVDSHLRANRMVDQSAQIIANLRRENHALKERLKKIARMAQEGET